VVAKEPTEKGDDARRVKLPVLGSWAALVHAQDVVELTDSLCQTDGNNALYRPTELSPRT